MKTKLNELSEKVRKRVEENNLELALIDIPRENPDEFIRDCPIQNECEYKRLRRECFFHGMYKVCPKWNEYQDKLGIGGYK